MRPKSEYALRGIELAKKALSDEAELNKIARKAKVNADDLKEEYELFLDIEDLKDEIELLQDAGEDTTEKYGELRDMTKQLTDIQRRHG